MTSTAAPPRTTHLISKAANSGGGGTSGSCQDCNKQGVAILPVVSGVLPNVAKAGLVGLDAWLDSSDLTEHWYFLRTLPAGYLYVLKSNRAGQAPAHGGWDVYVVDAEGLLRKTAPASQAPSPDDVTPMSQACRLKGDNVPAQVIAIDPVQHPTAWMAFSRYRWTPEVLSSYASNVDGCRDQRMRSVNVTAVAAGQLGKGQAVPFGTRMGAHVAQAVADYGSDASRATVNRHALMPVRSRGGQLEGLTRVMAEISSATPAKCGAVLVLDDVVGITQDLNLRRNRMAADAAHAAALGDADRARRRVIAEIIEGIRASAQANPGPWWDRNYGPERFLKHINEGEWQRARAEDAQFKAAIANIDKISVDFVTVKESPTWLAQQRFDFDPADDTAARNHGEMVANCLAGSGLTKIERERVWQPVIESTLEQADNWLDRALLALFPGALNYINTDNKQDKAYDLVKGATALSRELTSTGLSELSALHNTLRQRRAGNAAMAALVEACGAQLARLQASNPTAHYKLMRKVAVALLIRDGQVAQPKIVTGPFAKVAQWIQEVAVGPVRRGMAPIRVRSDITNYDAYQGTRGNFGDEGWRLTETMEGAVVFDAPRGGNQNAEVVAWVITRVQAGERLDPVLMRRLGLQHIDLTRPLPAGVVNPFLENSLKRFAGRSDVLLGAGVLFFQWNSFLSALTDFKTKQGAMDKAGGGIGMLTAVLSASAGGLEIGVAVQTLRGVPGTQLVGMQVWAARLGMAAAVIEGSYLVAKGVDKLRDGDRDSAYWTIGSGVAVVAAGVASTGAGLAVAATLAAGGTASTATVLGITMGPIGWALLAIALIGAVIYLSWQAFSTDDANLLPVEYWLDAGVFGKKQFLSGETGAKSPFADSSSKTVTPFRTVNDELAGLQQITLVAVARITGARDRHGYAVISYYSVAIPKYEPGTRLELKFTALVGDQRKDGGRIVCEDGRPQPTVNGVSRNFTGRSDGPTIKRDEATGVMRVEGWFATLQEEPATERFIEWVAGRDYNPNALYAERIEMAVAYEPNRNSMPGFKVTAKDIN